MSLRRRALLFSTVVAVPLLAGRTAGTAEVHMHAMAIGPEGKGEMTKSEDRRRSAQSKDTTLPPPRDPDIAVREEFELARAQGTRAAWETFIARHSDHPLAKEARREFEKVRARGQ